jgi:hypothetical protein
MPRTYEHSRHLDVTIDTYTHRLVVDGIVILADPECGLWNVDNQRRYSQPCQWDAAKAERLEKPVQKRFFRGWSPR